MKKKLFVLILVITVIITTMQTFAVENEEPNFPDVSRSTGYVEEVNALTDAGIIKGDTDGNFRPDDKITRAEFSAILCRTMGDSVVRLAESGEKSNENIYSDVPSEHWAAGYINVATKYDAIKGFGDGTFGPELPVTNEQVIKMLVAAWGYEEEAKSLGGYPNGYMEVASRFGVTDSVLFNYGNASKRWVVSMFVCGVLEKLPISEDIDAKLNPPEVPIINAEIDESDPLPENTEYVKDPISILQRVTPKSAKYERKTFEQQVPQGEFPFFVQNGEIYSRGEMNYKITIANPGTKLNFVEGTLGAGIGISIENLPVGKWQVGFAARNGAVSDTYFCDIVKTDDDVYFDSIAFRYTYLRVNSSIKETRESVIISNHTPNSRLPFQIKLQDGTLYINYDKPIEVNQYFYCALSNDFSAFIEGPKDVMKPIVIEDIEPGEYHAEIGIRYNTGDDVGFYGSLIIMKDDLVLTGDLITIFIDGYEFDYSE